MIRRSVTARVRHCSHMTSIADLASIVTSGATCVALVFAGLELQRSRAHDRYRRQVEIEGVAVSWSPSRNPQGPREGDAQGRGRWVYDITAYNPGQLPISNIEVKVFFVLDVQRLHYQGTIDDPVRTLILRTPVLAGGKDFTWHRTLLIKFAGAHAALKETTAVISFYDPEGTCRHNSWPKRKPQTDGQANFKLGPASSRHTQRRSQHKLRPCSL